MIEEQELIASTHKNIEKNMLMRIPSTRIVRSLAIGVSVTLLITAIEIILLVVLNPLHLSGLNGVGRVFALYDVVLKTPLLLLIPLVELIGITTFVFMLIRPLALRTYLKELQQAQEEYCSQYTSLLYVLGVFGLFVAYFQSPAPENAEAAIQQGNMPIADLLQGQNTNVLLIGATGTGKTIALRHYLYKQTQRRSTLVRRRGIIPIYIPLKDYGLFLKSSQQASSTIDTVNLDEEGSNSISLLASQRSLLDFFHICDLPGIDHLRPYIARLIAQGRMVFLCDGLNEVEHSYQDMVVRELMQWARTTGNRLVLTSHEADYRNQADLVSMVNEGKATLAVISPLTNEQIRDYVERFIQQDGGQMQYTAGQVMQIIERSRLRYFCTNLLLLSLFLEVIKTTGKQRGISFDTRGRLLKAYVAQLIEHERRQPAWAKYAPSQADMIQFLSQLAFAAHWTSKSSSIQLPISQGFHLVSHEAHGAELVNVLLIWLDKHPVSGLFAASANLTLDPLAELFQRTELVEMLQFARSVGLIEITSHGTISFRHEMIANYFIAEYLFAITGKQRTGSLPLRQEVLADVGRWSEPVALWAGLLDTPEALGERFLMQGRSNPTALLPSLVLGLVSLGVAWIPPQGDAQREVKLPAPVGETLLAAIRNRNARRELARLVTRSIAESGPEMYLSLLAVFQVEGIEEVLVLLDVKNIAELFFTYLYDIVDNAAYEAEVKRLIRVLARFGQVAIERATELSRPAPGRTLRLRAVAISILGSSNERGAVTPLIARLSDTDQIIVQRTVNALIRLGPTLSLEPVLQELDNPMPSPFTRQIHLATLKILERFLDDQDPQRKVTSEQQQHILETLVKILSSDYAPEPEVQQQASIMLVRLGHGIDNGIERDQRWEKVVMSLIQNLASNDKMMVENAVQTLHQIGESATPLLVEQLKPQTAEIIRVHIIRVIESVRDLRALPHLLNLVADTSAMIQQQAAHALFTYTPVILSGV